MSPRHASLLVLVSLACACGGKQAPAPSHDDPDLGHPAPPADAPIVQPDAPATAAAFATPPPLAPAGPATPASKKCRADADADAGREEAREAAALDAALRAQGFTPLYVVEGGTADGSHRGPSRSKQAHVIPAGNVFQLPVGTIAGCGGTPPVVAMTASHEVFVAEPQLVPKQQRTVTECMNTCRGVCGANLPDHVALAQVPADAVLGAPREIKVPIDVQVTFRFAKQQECNVP